MGLLDDAIREHLDLKRRRGADPGMVAREERDALAPVFGEEGDERHDLAEDQSPGDGAADTAAATLGEDRPFLDAQPADLSTIGQETAELDMQVVMDEDAEVPDAPGADPAAGREDVQESPQVEPLEWEVSGSQTAELLPEDIPGQERLSFE
jgi:hypothetical protein